eukprot:12407118-Karenia_brevis.AAC.1
MGSTERRLDYESCRKYLVSLANQRISARIPRPAGIGGVDQENTSQQEEENQESGAYDNWGGDVGAITNPSNPNIKCYACGGIGYVGANCPNKGKGKGKRR